MRSSRQRKISDSDFLEGAQSHRTRIKQKEKLSEDIKAKYIQELEDRNRKLKYQIIKINEMLEQQKDKPAQKKEYKLIPNESSGDVLKKELANVYQQIKNYEREINNLEKKQSGGLVIEKMSRLQTILKEKTSHLEKLKGELSLLTKNSLDNAKKLKNNAGKEELENMMLKYNEEIKILREKARHAEEKEKKKMENAKKQYDYIKKLERELIENGISMDEIEEMKKNNIFNQIYDKMSKGKEEKMEKPPINHKQPKNEKEQIEDLTIDRYNEVKNEIKLYKKLHQDYDKRLDQLEKEKKLQDAKTAESRQKLSERQAEVQQLQQEINELKMKMRKVNIKANYSIPNSAGESKNKEKPRVSIPKPKKDIKTLADQTHLKYDQKGQASQKGKRFTDRATLGKNTNCKITTVKVWTQKSTFAICGIQCIYSVGSKVKAGQEHISKEVKKNCTENVMELFGDDYVKSVSGHLSPNNIIEYLLLLSKNNVAGRFGIANKPTQKQFNYDIEEDELPICIYGSLLPYKDGQKELSSLEHLGMEISHDNDKDQI